VTGRANKNTDQDKSKLAHEILRDMEQEDLSPEFTQRTQSPSMNEAQNIMLPSWQNHRH
jgi:hypothetical protein